MLYFNNIGKIHLDYEFNPIKFEDSYFDISNIEESLVSNSINFSWFYTHPNKEYSFYVSFYLVPDTSNLEIGAPPFVIGYDKQITVTTASTESVYGGIIVPFNQSKGRYYLCVKLLDKSPRKKEYEYCHPTPIKI